MYANHDEAMRAEELAELEDKLDLAKLNAELNDGHPISISVREYAIARGLQPQRVYYYIRTGKIEQRPCGECGRKVINIEQADAIFVPKEEEGMGGE